MSVETDVHEEAEQVELYNASTRPTNVTRKAERARSTRKVTRYTLDLESEQHNFLRLFALNNNVKASLVMRALLYLLETDVDLANRVIDEIFAEDETVDEEQLPTDA